MWKNEKDLSNKGWQPLPDLPLGCVGVHLKLRYHHFWLCANCSTLFHFFLVTVRERGLTCGLA